MDTDEQQIRQLIDRWHRATAAGDLRTVLTLMTDDVVFFTAGQAPMNKEAFAAAFRQFAGRVRIESAQDIKEIRTSGDLAYCWSQISVVMTSIESATQNRRAGHVLSIFRRSPSGEWLLARDANLITG